MTDILFAIFFFLPAAVANMAPIFANNISLIKTFNTPIDGGKTFRDKRILGDHKTYRGLISGAVGGLVGALIQMFLYSNFQGVKDLTDSIDYSEPSILLLGIAMGLGALIGDSFKSFFKRQAGIASGKGWFPFDQTDFIFGSALFALPFVSYEAKTFYTALVLALILHPAMNILGWLLKMKPRPF